MNKYVCIHGHFYQPPRENAWLEQIEVQESAAPFHDWNERINDECYGPNAHARILNENGRIIDIINNYEKISFNFGPTLLSWMELHRPDSYVAILEADTDGAHRFGGHGPAIAQVYNHMIMPLATRRDKETQIIWGLYDFEKRFGRKSEGIWLAETAVDMETLELLVDHGVKYTILAPNQGKRFRKPNGEWQEGIDPNQPYFIQLKSNRRIAVFFYNGDISQQVAFSGLLNDGNLFASKLMSGFKEDADTPELLHIATDGESYGHHHKLGEMALAYCLHQLEQEPNVQITNYGQYLELFPPTLEAEIHENSSWSCAHGVERWRSNCGCHTGGDDSWNQQWRDPLRRALDYLKGKLDALYELEMKEMHPDPWQLRNAFIEVVFQAENRDYDAFFKKHLPKLDEAKKTHAIRLLEMQRNGLLMFTSCGWFFNDVSGIETLQILQYADRAIQLAERESDLNLHTEFLKILAEGKSNIGSMGTIAEIYESHVSPKRMTLSKVGMHYAVHVLFSENPNALQVFNYTIETQDFIRVNAGQQILCLGRAIVKSKVTLSVKYLSFAVVYIGNHHLVGGTSNDYDEQTFKLLVDRLKANFQNSHLASVIYDIEKHFDQTRFSFFDLMKDEQKKILDEVIQGNVSDMTSTITRAAQQNYSLLNLMLRQKLEVPRVLWQNQVSKLELDLTEAMKDWLETGDYKSLFAALDEFLYWGISPHAKFGFAFSQAFNEMLEAGFTKSAEFLQLLEKLEQLNVSVNLIGIQNFVFHQLKKGENGSWKLLGDKIQLEVK
jgi:alpha-amylase/alpha-mannosidase (GH57 family)